MERLFSEPQWRAIAEVEVLTGRRPAWDGFHFWCVKRRLCGPTYSGGEFYLGWRDGGSEFRVFERVSGLELSYTDEKLFALEKAASRLSLIGDYWPNLMAIWTPRWEPKRLEMERSHAASVAKQKKKVARVAAGRQVGRRARAVFAASNGKCHYCGCELDLKGRWHIEHKFPRALFGGSEQDNLVAACVPCNMRKKDKTDLEFQALLQAEQAVHTAQSSVSDVNPRGAAGVVHSANSLAQH